MCGGVVSGLRWLYELQPQVPIGHIYGRDYWDRIVHRPVYGRALIGPPDHRQPGLELPHHLLEPAEFPDYYMWMTKSDDPYDVSYPTWRNVERHPWIHQWASGQRVPLMLTNTLSARWFTTQTLKYWMRAVGVWSTFCLALTFIAGSPRQALVARAIDWIISAHNSWLLRRLLRYYYTPGVRYMWVVNFEEFQGDAQNADDVRVYAHLRVPMTHQPQLVRMSVYKMTTGDVPDFGCETHVTTQIMDIRTANACYVEATGDIRADVRLSLAKHSRDAGVNINPSLEIGASNAVWYHLGRNAESLFMNRQAYEHLKDAGGKTSASIPSMAMSWGLSMFP